MIRLVNVLVLIVYCEPNALAPVLVTLAVPEPIKVPVPPEIIAAAAGLNVEPEPTVNVPPTPNELLPVKVALSATVMLENNKFELLLEIAEPLLKVIVPAEG